jgi:GH24 family phage-related lysozyme (muramidase)
MMINNEGMALLKALEGCRLTAYKLKGETYYTIGYGHYGADVKKGMTISQAEADALFSKDLEKFEKHVNSYAVKKFPSLNENQFAALVSYCYNRGLGGLKQLVNASNTITELGNNIVVYWGSAELYKEALIKRRKKEQKLFNTPVDNVKQTNTKTVKEIAKEVVNGMWGNGAQRKDALTKAGYNYKEVQEAVNAYYNRPTLPSYAPVLQRGCRGMQVERLQKCLTYFEYEVPRTGFFGDMTYYSLVKYQQDNGLVPDGVFGRFTYESMRTKL